MIFLTLFLSFFFIGLAGFGGYYSLLAFLQETLVEQYGWLSSAEFADIVVFSQTMPGSALLNAATWGGYAATNGTMGFWPAMGGSALALIGLSAPAFLWTALAIHFKKNRWVKNVAKQVVTLLRIVVPGLIAAAALLLVNEETFGSPTTDAWHFGISIFLFLATLVGPTLYRINALLMVLLCGTAGWILL